VAPVDTLEGKAPVAKNLASEAGGPLEISLIGPVSIVPVAVVAPAGLVSAVLVLVPSSSCG